MYTHFALQSPSALNDLVNKRRFETKIGERVQCSHQLRNIYDAIEGSSAKYVLFGICEEIGVLANLGRPGTSTAWESFLPVFLNLQSNDWFDGNEVLILGKFDFADVKDLIDKNAQTAQERMYAYRHAVNMIDEEVERLAKDITSLGKIPVALGGGHNNAYGMIKGCAKGLAKINNTDEHPSLNVLNLDAHADLRALEGRHSGNAFSYAKSDGFLGKYIVLGLQENYLTQTMLTEFQQNPDFEFASWESMYLRNELSFEDAVKTALYNFSNNKFGVELDMDVIENTGSSAASPTGISFAETRKAMHLIASLGNSAYLHISEAIYKNDEKIIDEYCGKKLAILVSDFIKNNP